MENQPDKRQQFRFWYPFWGNPASGTAPRTPVPPPRRTPANQPKPRSPVQTPTPPTNQSQPIKSGNSRTPSPSPSPSLSSSSSSPSSSPGKQNQPRRVSRTTSSPLPSPMQSPSRRSPRSDQAKKSTRDESAQGSKQSPRTTPTPSGTPSPSQDVESSPPEASKKQGTTQEEQFSDKEPIETTKGQDSKNAEGNIDKPTSQEHSKVEKENGSKNSDEIETKSILFNPPIGEKPARMDIPNIIPTEIDEEKGQESHEPKPLVGLVPSTIEEASETQTKEDDKQRHNESHLDKSIPPDHINHQENENEMPKEIIKDLTMTPKRDDSPKETIKVIPKSSQDENPKETIKEIAQPPDLNNLCSNYNSENLTANTNNSDNKGHREIENPTINNPKQKEKIMDVSSSTPTSFQKGIKEGISKLIRKINTENAFNHGSESGTSIITLAGENKGASMYIGNENEAHNSTSTWRESKLDESSGMSSEGKNEIEIEKDLRISANVNSNVQSVNNSMLQESRCDTRDPGVHLRLSSRMKKEKMRKREAGASKSMKITYGTNDA